MLEYKAFRSQHRICPSPWQVSSEDEFKRVRRARFELALWSRLYVTIWAARSATHCSNSVSIGTGHRQLVPPRAPLVG